MQHQRLLVLTFNVPRVVSGMSWVAHHGMMLNRHRKCCVTAAAKPSAYHFGPPDLPGAHALAIYFLMVANWTDSEIARNLKYF